MIKIAVVDDDELVCKEIVRIISKFNICYDFDFRPEYYCSCEEAYNSIVNGCDYDLIYNVPLVKTQMKKIIVTAKTLYSHPKNVSKIYAALHTDLAW